MSIEVLDGNGDEPPDPTESLRRAEDRIVAAEQFNLASTEAWWRLVLIGDDTFQKLAACLHTLFYKI